MLVVVWRDWKDPKTPRHQEDQDMQHSDGDGALERLGKCVREKDVIGGAAEVGCHQHSESG